MPTRSIFKAEKWLAQVISGIAPSQLPVSKAEWDSILSAAAANRVTALCHERLGQSETKKQCPEWFLEALKKHSLLFAANEMAHCHELNQILPEFSRSGIEFLLIKGTPLAYTIYPQPFLRERCDTDILFRTRDQAHAAQKLLEKRGYSRFSAISGDYVSTQFICYRTSANGVSHSLDMHWRLSNDLFIARTFSFEGLESDALPVPPLGENVKTLGMVHALLLACMHYIVNLNNEDHSGLYWLYDIHLLAGRLSEAEWSRFSRLAIEKKLEIICVDSLKTTQNMFSTEMPDHVLQVLQSKSGETSYAPHVATRSWQIQLMNFQALPDWRAKVRLAREHLLPAPGYMKKKYQVRHTALLPFYYGARIIHGLPKLFRKLT